MCGIVGYVGTKNSALPILINGLKKLEYRGYDSAGIAYFTKNTIEIKKTKGKVKDLEKITNLKKKTNIGIAHTRWATHGVPSQINAHPHQCKKITIVHNGIIENYETLKKELNDSFLSETDSEVIAVLLNDLYAKTHDLLSSLLILKKKLKGSYALGILCADEPTKIYAIRKDSPLIIAKGKDGNLIASDIPAIISDASTYCLLNENEIAIIEADKITILNQKLKKVKKEYIPVEERMRKIQKDKFKHFMLKEINEQPQIITNLLKDYSTFSMLKNNFHYLKKYKQIDIIACGSAYHVGLYAKNIIEEYANIKANTEIASEYRYKKNFLKHNCLAIFISQSGETADTLACLRKIKQQHIDTLAIVNVCESSIARESKYVIYTNAGPEIAVATTKAFSAQMLILLFLTLYLAYQNNKLTEKEIENILQELKNCPSKMEKLLKNNYKTLAKHLQKHDHIFFLGRGNDYPLALEGSLKLKEISYIHSEAYPAGELKHGTISLIETNTPVISILTDPITKEKTISNIKETKARGAYTVAITTEKLSFVEKMILIPKTIPLLQPLLTTIPLQLLAYEVAKQKKCDIDKPRNLAKSVTVE